MLPSATKAALASYLSSSPKPAAAAAAVLPPAAPNSTKALLQPHPTNNNPPTPPTKTQLTLPFYSHLSPLDASLTASGPTLLIGATGCGKSTQLPQHLLRTASTSTIVVAQPRRLAATSIASRVSSELSSPVGGLVGYSIRGDTRKGRDTRCLFVTYGVLIRMLASDSAAALCTHLVLDEVHERSADLDLILLHLKTSKDRPKIILMSATVDERVFSSYLPELTVVTVPGRTFPVERQYLEHALAHTNYICPLKSASARPNGPLPDDPVSDTLTAEITSVKKLIDDTADGNPDVISNLKKRLASLTSAQNSVAPKDPTTALLLPLSLNQTQTKFSLNPTAARSLRTLDPNAIPNGLIARLIEKHMDTPGDVLVFLPGLKEISALQSHLSSNNEILVLPLHSSLSTAEQHKVFLPSPASKTKVILATSIAEASITVPSITLVIDSCLSRSQSLDPTTNLSHLSTHLSSKSSIDQRAGRAGRVQAGTCYHLILSPIVQSLQPSPEPEISNTPIDSFSLRARHLLRQTGPTGTILKALLTPPSATVSKTADETLIKSSALDPATFDLTSHGTVLAQLPLSLPHARALVASSRLGVLEPISLLLAALTSPSSDFSVEEKRRADKFSDHVALLRLARTSPKIKKEAERLSKLTRELLGPNDFVAASPLPSLFASLLISSPQVAPFYPSSIQYVTPARTHSLKPHLSSVLHGLNSKSGHVFFGDVMKLPSGAMVMDASLIPSEAVALFTELEISSVSSEEKELLRSFRGRIEKIIIGEEGGLEASNLLALVLKHVVRDWSGLPPGWEYEEDRKIWITRIEGGKGISSMTRPTESASAAVAKKISASGSLARAEKELARKGGDRGTGPATITKASGAGASKKITEEEAKLAVKARLKAEEDKERKKVTAASKASSKVNSVTKMLRELDLEEKYASANISNDLVVDILAFVKEGEKEEAEKGIDGLIADAEMIGGSASRVRRYLLEGGKGSASAKKGKSDKGRGGKAVVVSAATAAPELKKKKKKVKDDLSLLEGDGGGKKKGRGSSRR
ncbi:hypothetical protein TrST_g317 [Triparma strigata]|uniref:P-loop containing nucleoside triphosphate hydrolase protein n=1 Tax=Triparma strigata TaxID=1606541 RepID=A0A9W6ZG00_9STRA|nr:hypothetical protein TrST_g317 [Triparma strigata]